MSDETRYCAGCGFDRNSVWPWWGSEWHTAHRAAHMAAAPDLDEVSVHNLDDFIAWAKAREAEIAEQG